MFISDQYEIIEEIANGSMGTVYKAHQLMTQRFVAIKLLHQSLANDDSSIRRFQREAKTTSSLEHDNIVRLFSFGIAPDDRPYFVMEYLEGDSLRTRIEQKGSLALELFFQIFGEACSALAYAHQNGILHRDLKPENIFLVKSAQDHDTAKILDFGIAKYMEGFDSQSGGASTSTGNKLLGSPAYMSPEQCRGQKLDARSDIYSLACVMYEAISGSKPFIAETVQEVMLKHLSENPQPLNERVAGKKLQPSLCKLIARCLSKNLDERPQTAAELGSLIEMASREEPVLSGSVLPNKFLLIWCGVAFALLLIVGVYGFMYANKNAATLPSKSWIEIDNEFQVAQRANKAGRNSDAISAYRQILSEIETMPGTRAFGGKSANMRYACFMGIAKARQHTPDAKGAVAIDDWRKINEVAVLANPGMSEQVGDAKLHLAQLLSEEKASPAIVEECISLTEKAAKIYATCRNSVAILPIINKAQKSAEPQIVKLSIKFHDSQSILGHMLDLQGKHDQAIQLLQESVQYRLQTQQKASEFVLRQAAWLCQAEHNAGKEAAEKTAISNLFK
ncbi:MAG: serine/threonine protein kinase, partial [Candidatus Obscuribacterales bacterium]|nr:serine/threonine protein kinase [Candidatus Obscuribacterales bacterium]